MAKVIIKGDRGGGLYYEWKNIRNGSPIVFEPLEMTLILSQGLGEQCMSHTHILMTQAMHARPGQKYTCTPQANISTHSPIHNTLELYYEGIEGGGMYYEWKNIRNGSPNVFEPLEMTLIMSQGLGEQCMRRTYAV